MLSQSSSARPAWMPWILAIAAFWLSSNIVLDFLIMPIMSVSGMTTQADFAATGYSLFWSFNRIELLCAAVILTGVLALRRRPSEFEVSHSGSRCRWAVAIGVTLLSTVLLDTYVLTPHLSALALNISTAATNALPTMNLMHLAYWSVEGLKLAGLLGILGLCWHDLSNRDSTSMDAIA